MVNSSAFELVENELAIPIGSRKKRYKERPEKVPHTGNAPVTISLEGESVHLEHEA